MKLSQFGLRLLFFFLLCQFAPEQNALAIGGMDESVCRVPAFLQSSVNLDPNILILIDSSGSMNWEAYLDHDKDNSRGANVISPGDSYYGIFEASNCYSYNYTDDYFYVSGPARADYSCDQQKYPASFAGSFLNQASGSRLEITKKVFTGGLWHGGFLWGDPAGHHRYGCWQNYNVEVPADFVPGGNSQTVSRIVRYTGNGSCSSYYSPNFYSTFSKNGAATLRMRFFEATSRSCSEQLVTTPEVRRDLCTTGTISNCTNTKTAPSCSLCSPAVNLPGDSCLLLGGGWTYSCRRGKKNNHMECGNGACRRRSGTNCPGTLTAPYDEVCLRRCRRAKITGSPGIAECTYSPELCDCTELREVCDSGVGIDRDQNYTLRILTAKDPWDGLIQEAYNKGRWSVFTFDLSGSQGGRVETLMGDTLDNTVQGIRRVVARTNTPLAEALYTSLLYYAQTKTSPYHPGADFPLDTNGPLDPLYEASAKQAVSCRDNNILVLTDGEPTADGSSIPNYVADDGDGIGATARYSDVQAWWPPTNHPEWAPGDWGSYYGDWYDDVAFWGHTADLRPDLAGFQNANIYSVYAFGTKDYARFLMWEAGKNGIFQDINGNGVPDRDLTEEWDIDQDGDPDGFYLAENGDKLKQQLRAAFAKILERSSSVAPIDYLGAAGTGQGIATQAFFNPSLVSGPDVKTTWAGFLRSFWVDQGGFLREDSNPNQKLDLDGSYPESYDAVISFRYDPKQSKTFVDLYDNGPDPLNPSATPVIVGPTKEIQDLYGVYDFGLQLAEQSPDNRRIYTTVNDAKRDFDLTLVTPLLDGGLLGQAVTTAEDATLLISYIRGEDIPNMRSRLYIHPDVGPITWKMGDSINSETLFAGPVAQAFLPSLYDTNIAKTHVEPLRDSFALHVSQHASDPVLAYTGSNDGMLHAFSLGIVKSDGAALEFLDDSKSPSVNATPMERGDEVWAWIPEAALPHLNWLTEEKYCHVYFVDGKTKIWDLNIFPVDSSHPDGWGRLMAVSLGLGCPEIDLATRTSFPAYVFLDVTDPYNPQYYGKFSDPELGSAYWEPVVVDYWNNDEWHHKMVIIGGPDDDLEVVRTKQNYLWVLDLPYQGSGTFGSSTAIPLPGFLSTFTPIGGSVADFDEVGFADLIGTFDWPNSALANGTSLGHADLESDGIYIGGFVPNAGGGFDGVMFVVDLKSGRGFGNSIAQTPHSWRIRPLIRTPNKPMNSLAFPYSQPIIQFNTGRIKTLNDMSNQDQQGLFMVLDPCFSGEDGDTAAVTCSGGGFFVPDISNLLDMSSFLYDDVNGVTDCQGTFTPCTEGGIYAETVQSFGSKFLFSGAGERAVGNMQTPTGTAVFSTFSPVSTGICSFGGTSNVYSIKMLADGKSPAGLYTKLENIGTGQVTIGDTVNGRTLIQDATGTATVVTLMPKYAGPYFGFGPLGDKK